MIASARLPASLENLGGRLRELGGQVQVRALADHNAAKFGHYHYSAAKDRSGEKHDYLYELFTSIVEHVAGWCRDLSRPPVATTPEGGAAAR